MLAIFASAVVAGYESIHRLLEPRDVDALLPLAAAGAIGFAGNWLAAIIRTRAGRRPNGPAFIADGAHARADAYVSLAVVASAAAVALGLRMADPLIGLVITAVILFGSRTTPGAPSAADTTPERARGGMPHGSAVHRRSARSCSEAPYSIAWHLTPRKGR